MSFIASAPLANESKLRTITVLMEAVLADTQYVRARLNQIDILVTISLRVFLSLF